LPAQTFALADADAAIAHMAQARHVGKLVLVPPARPQPLTMRADGASWITGGLGGLGLATARWLVGLGARHLVLTGRHAGGNDAATAIDALRRAGARVDIELADCADPVRMTEVFGMFGRARPPLRGVVHAAGTLHDGVLGNQRWVDAVGVLRGKADGAWLLHELTKGSVGRDALDFFVLYSAAGAKLGAAGQGLYAAANAELDALALRRRAAGLPALAVAWGLWDGVGMAAGSDGSAWRARGLKPITPDSGFAHLRALLEAGVPHGVVLPIDAERFFAQPHAAVDNDYFAALRAPHAAAPATLRVESTATALQRLRALPAPQRTAALQDLLVQQVLTVLGLPAGTSLDARVPLKDAGLDSLMAVELRNALTRVFGQPLPVTLLFDHPTLTALGAHLAQRLALVEPAPPAHTDGVTAPRRAIDADLEALSEAEAEALLLAELNGNFSTLPDEPRP
jgi:hypothetical protein